MEEKDEPMSSPTQINIYVDESTHQDIQAEVANNLETCKDLNGSKIWKCK